MQNNIFEKDRKRFALQLVSISFFVSLGTNLLAFAVPLVSLDAKVSGAWLGSAFALYFFARLLSAPLGGMWVDRIGARIPMLLACGLGVLCPILFIAQTAWIAHHTLIGIYATQIILGLSGGLLRPAVLSALGSAVHNKPVWFARHGFVFHCATFFGALLAGLLYCNHALQPVLWGTSICLGIAFCFSFFFPHTRQLQNKQPSSEHNFLLWPILLGILGRSLALGASIAFYPMLLSQTLATTSFSIACIYSINSLSTCLVLPFIGKLRTSKPELCIACGMCLSGFSLFILGQSSQLQYFLIAGIFTGLGTALSLPFSMTLLSQTTQKQASIFGLAQTVTGIGFLFGPFLGGFIIQWTGDTGAALSFFGLLGILLTIPILLIALRRFSFWSRSYSFITIATAMFLILIAVFSFPSMLRVHDAKGNMYCFADTAMGTSVHLTLYAPSRLLAQKAVAAAMNSMRSLQHDFDHRNPQGSIGQINRAAGKQFVTPSPLAFALIQRALNFAAKTKGIFDPSIGAVTSNPFFFALDSDFLADHSQFVDYRKVKIKNAQIMLAEPKMALDLGGIAKGAIIDHTVSVLQNMGISQGIVEAGGDFRCFGAHVWKIGVQNPRGTKDTQIFETVCVQNKAVCTSGDYRRFILFDVNGKAVRRHHIFSPQSMDSAQKSISVTVIADTAEEADSLATALFIMGAEDGLKFLEEYDFTASAQWINPDLSITSSPKFSENYSVAKIQKLKTQKKN